MVYSCSIWGYARTDITSTDYGMISTSSQLYDKPKTSDTIAAVCDDNTIVLITREGRESLEGDRYSLQQIFLTSTGAIVYKECVVCVEEDEEVDVDPRYV